MPNQKLLQVVWRPEDAREVFERAATIQAIHAAEPELEVSR